MIISESKTRIQASRSILEWKAAVGHNQDTLVDLPARSTYQVVEFHVLTHHRIAEVLPLATGKTLHPLYRSPPLARAERKELKLLVSGSDAERPGERGWPCFQSKRTGRSSHGGLDKYQTSVLLARPPRKWGEMTQTRRLEDKNIDWCSIGNTRMRTTNQIIQHTVQPATGVRLDLGPPVTGANDYIRSLRFN